MAKNSNDVIKQIEKHYASLSPSGQTIAQYLQRNPIAVVTQSTSHIAEQTNTSKATVSRFFRQLGFESHQEAKNTLLTLREQGVPVSPSTTAVLQHEQELNNISQTFDNIDIATLTAIAEKLAHAQQITLIGFRNAYPLALHFRQQLKQIRTSVRLLPQPGQTLGEDLVDLGKDDVVVLFGFRRRTRQFKHVLHTLSHCQTILITDPTGQVYRDNVKHLLVCHLGNHLSSQVDNYAPFDSYAAPMSLVSTLCNFTYSALGDSASERVKAITSLYGDLDELEPSERK